MSKWSGTRDIPDIFMVDPENSFEVADQPINPYMERGEVDEEKALKQFERQVEIYRQELGLDVHVYCPPEEAYSLSDIAFTANHCFPFWKDEQPMIVPSNMKYDQRKRETDFVLEIIKGEEPGEMMESNRQKPVLEGIEAVERPDSVFEGSGDAVSGPENTILVGYGQRTEEEAVEEISDLTGKDTVGLELVEEWSYHLDIAMEDLGDGEAMVVEEALSDSAVDELKQIYDDIIYIPGDEARKKLAGNAHCPDGENVVINTGIIYGEEEDGEYRTAERLRDAGYNVIEMDNSEFGKAGGSVDCLKLQFSRKTDI